MAFLDIEPRIYSLYVTDKDLSSGKYGPDYHFDVKNKTFLREKLFQIMGTIGTMNIKPEDYETGNPYLAETYFKQHGLNEDVSIMEVSEINIQKIFKLEARRYSRVGLLDTNILFCLMEQGRESHKTLVTATRGGDLLSDDQKKELGDDINYAQLAHSQLICRNIPIAVKLAYNYTLVGNFYRDLQEMIAVANLNLINAVDRYSFRFISDKTGEPGKFSTFAYRIIELGFIDYMDKTADMSVAFSIEDIIGRHSGDFIESSYFMVDHSFEGNPRNSDDIIDSENKVREMLDMFDKDDQKIVTLRFGIGGKYEMTPEEVAGVLGISEIKVKDRLKEIISKCQRKYIHSQKHS
ncbi:MAG TPA: sigma-70 family RNA polymerase sigma factor [Candidatus Saccharimonadales bacterium]|nr:sigma-70 family RNA polymerase sigma factor [Candidatus Saccharimonadales bacterium]